MEDAALPTSILPSQLLDRLLVLRPVLEHNGSVVTSLGRQGRMIHRLRYRVLDPLGGKVRQKSIPLLCKGHGLEVTRLLSQWRQQRREQQEAQREADLLYRQQVRELRRQVQDAAGGGRRRRRRVGREFDRALAAGGEELVWFTLFGYSQPGPRPGRPRKGVLKLARSGTAQEAQTSPPQARISGDSLG